MSESYLPLKGDGEGIYIFDTTGQVFAEVRGWGHLQYGGEAAAIAEQKARQDFMVRACNSYDDLLAACKDALNIQHFTVNELSALKVNDQKRALIWTEKVYAIEQAIKAAIAKAEDKEATNGT